MKDLIKNIRDFDDKPVGISIPFTPGVNTSFNMNYTTLDHVKTKLRNLLLTNHNERVLKSVDYGANLRALVFENTSNEKINDYINDTIDKWMPEITIKTLEINKTDHKFNVKIEFEFNPTQQIEQIEININ